MKIWFGVLTRLLLAPVVLILSVVRVIATVAERLYSFCHGMVIGLPVVPLALACFFHMWQNALVFAVLGIAGCVIIAALVIFEVMLEAAGKSLISAMLFAS